MKEHVLNILSTLFYYAYKIVINIIYVMQKQWIINTTISLTHSKSDNINRGQPAGVASPINHININLKHLLLLLILNRSVQQSIITNSNVASVNNNNTYINIVLNNYFADRKQNDALNKYIDNCLLLSSKHSISECFSGSGVRTKAPSTARTTTKNWRATINQKTRKEVRLYELESLSGRH